MGLTMSQRRAVTVVKARAYGRGTRSEKTWILSEWVELAGWNRGCARRGLRLALALRPVRARSAPVPMCGPRVVAALVVCWAVLRAPGKRLAPKLSMLVPLLLRDGELVLSDEEASSPTDGTRCTSMQL